MLNAIQFEEEQEKDKIALASYKELPNDSLEREQYLLNLSDDTARRVGILIRINACESCGESLLSSDSFCDGCGNSNDSYFDTLWAIVEAHPIGRPITRGC